MVDGDKEALHKKTARIQRLKASLKLTTTTRSATSSAGAARTFAGSPACPASTDTRRLPKLDPEAQSVTTVDFDNDGKPDLCLCGANKVVLLQNGGDGFIETALPGFTGGARAAVWADYNGDGLPDLLLATPTGPKLFTNLGKGQFRDDTNRLPKEAGLQPDRGRVGRLRRRRQARHPARQRLPRPAALQERPPGRAEDRAAEVRRLVRDRHVPRREPGGQLQDRVRRSRRRSSTQKKTYKGKRDMPTRSGRRRTSRTASWNSLTDVRAELRDLPLPRDRMQRRDRPAGLARQRTTRSRSGLTARRSSSDNKQRPADQARGSRAEAQAGEEHAA